MKLNHEVHEEHEVALGAIPVVKRPFAICFEASTGYGWLYDRLAKVAERVEVAHPGHLRIIFKSKRKCDRIDAQKLAKLLYLGAVPGIRCLDHPANSQLPRLTTACS